MKTYDQQDKNHICDRCGTSFNSEDELQVCITMWQYCSQSWQNELRFIQSVLAATLPSAHREQPVSYLVSFRAWFSMLKRS